MFLKIFKETSMALISILVETIQMTRHTLIVTPLFNNQFGKTQNQLFFYTMRHSNKYFFTTLFT